MTKFFTCQEKYNKVRFNGKMPVLYFLIIIYVNRQSPMSILIRFEYHNDLLDVKLQDTQHRAQCCRGKPYRLSQALLHEAQTFSLCLGTGRQLF